MHICLFSHVTIASDDDKVTVQIKTLNKKFETIEKKMKDMQSVIHQKDEEIKTIRCNLEALELIVKNVEKETGEIETRVLNESLSVLENSIRIPEKELFKCDQCKFTTESERGLKVHNKRKHAEIMEVFPQTCDFCDLQFQNKSEVKEHLKVHTYRTVDMKCEDCDFMANDDLSLEVHSSRKHSGNFECALCGFISKDEDHLNIHLHTCETFTCSLCTPKMIMTNVPAVTTHLSSKHMNNLKSINIIHTKMDRKDPDTVSWKTVGSATFLNNIN